MNHLRKHSPRWVPNVPIVFNTFTDRAGEYHEPQWNEYVDEDNKVWDMSSGLIVISNQWKHDEQQTRQTIAHEWQHHVQFHTGFPYDHTTLTITGETYEQSIKRYFTTSKSELDALRFEFRTSGIHEQWERLLFEQIKDLRKPPTFSFGNANVCY